MPKKRGFKDVDEINHGECEVFRDKVVKVLERNFPYERFEPVCCRDFEGIEEYYNPLFKNLIAFPYHAWFIHNGIHYDATSPEGVKSFYELKNYAYYTKLNEEEREKEFHTLNELEKELWDDFNEYLKA